MSRPMSMLMPMLLDMVPGIERGDDMAVMEARGEVMKDGGAEVGVGSPNFKAGGSCMLNGLGLCCSKNLGTPAANVCSCLPMPSAICKPCRIHCGGCGCSIVAI